MSWGPELNTTANAVSPVNEADSILGWFEYNLNGSGANVFESQSAVVNSGSTYAFKVDANDVGAPSTRIWLPLTKPPFNLIVGDKVKLEFWARHLGVGNDWVFHLDNLNSILDQSTLDVILTITDLTFVKYSVEFTMTKNTNYFGARELGANQGGIYLGTVSVKKDVGDLTQIENGQDGDVVREAINSNTISLFASQTANIPMFILSNIIPALQRIPSFFQRIDPAAPDSPNSQLDRFVMVAAPDPHGKFTELDHLNSFLKLVSPDNLVATTAVMGDIVIEQDTKAEGFELWDEFNKLYATLHTDLLPCLGNHDSNSRYSNRVDVVFSKAETKQYMIDPLVANVDGIVGDVLNVNANYYYKDYISPDGGVAYKIRVINMDQYDMPMLNDGVDYTYTMYSGRNYSQAQLTWLAEVALNLPSDDYHVFSLGHQRLDITSVFNTSTDCYLQIIDAFTQQGAVDMDDTTTDFEYDIDIDFAVINGFNGNFIAHAFGHNHTPVIDVVTINGRDYNNFQLPAVDQQRIGWSLKQSVGSSEMATVMVVDPYDRRIFLLRYGCPCDINGVGLPFGDFGIDTPITY